MTAPTTFHLVRHASHALLPHTLAGRSPGISLDTVGQHQASRLAQHLNPPIAALVSSPVQRCQETAAPLAARLGLTIQIDDGLEEIDFGAWTAQTFAALETDPAWRAWNRLRSLTACPGGETMPQAQARALATLYRLRRDHPGETVVLVSHADILKAILAPALGLPLDRLYRLTLDPASISTLVAYDEDWQVLAINGVASS